MRQGAEPWHERHVVPARIGDRDVDELGLNRVQRRVRVHVDVVAVDHQVGLVCRQRLGVVGAGDLDGLGELEVRLAAEDVGVDVDQYPVWPGRGEGHGLAQQAAGADGWMLVDDVGEVVADDDQVDAGMRSRSGLVLGQRLAGRLLDDE